jgi:hydrogenase-4 component B
MSRLGGLWRAMPWTAGLFALGAGAVSSLPPLNGFVSEWLVYLGLFDAAASRGTTTWAVLPAALMLALAGALALATFVKAAAVVFLGAPRTKAAESAHECGPLMLAPMLAGGTVCLAIGLAPMLFWPAIVRALGSWQPGWAGAEMPSPLAALGPAHLALAVLAAAAGTWLWRKARVNGRQRGLTWDCGYALPTARMQYTSGAFAGIAAGWFGWLLQPLRNIQRPRGAMPASARRIERIPETMLERVITPVGRAVLLVSTTVRRLQHGRIQAYILYLVVGLIALGVIVLWGGEK